MKRVVIDRFEGELAIVDCQGKTECLQKKSIPEEAQEGDILVIADNGVIHIDKAGTDESRNKIKKRMARLWED